jgi:hypothetical protein
VNSGGGRSRVQDFAIATLLTGALSLAISDFPRFEWPAPPPLEPGVLVSTSTHPVPGPLASRLVVAVGLASLWATVSGIRALKSGADAEARTWRTAVLGLAALALLAGLAGAAITLQHDLGVLRMLGPKAGIQEVARVLHRASVIHLFGCGAAVVGALGAGVLTFARRRAGRAGVVS